MRHLRAAPDASRFPFAIAALLLAVAAAYSTALTGPFQFDDYNVIADNPAAHSLSAWLDSMPGIRPLLKLSYALNWSLINGPLSSQPFGFHLTNLAIHLANTALVFGLLRQVPTAQRDIPAIAWIGAALFALHPAQTEVATYICGRSVGLMSLFYLAAIGAWLRERHALSLALFLGALLVRETAWTLPFALLLIESLRGASLRAALRKLLPHWIALAGGALLLVAIADYRSLLAHSLAIRGIADNLLAQIAGQFYLLTRPLLTLHTNIDPQIALDPRLLPLQAAVLLSLYVTGFALLVKTARLRWIGFTLLWFFLHLLPTNSLLPRNDLANDRQLYLASIGPALLIGRTLVALAGERFALPIGAALALLLAVFTYQRNADYRSEIALWEATARESPLKARVWNNLGYAHQQADAIEAARSAYSRALDLDPGSVRARINLSLLAPAPGDGTPAGK